MVLVMSFMKMLNLARVYDTLGCFLRMLELCFIDQIPLIVAYISSLLFFSFGYQSLNVSSLNQPTQCQGLGHFGRTIFSLWRSYLLYIDIPAINNYVADNTTLSADEEYYQTVHNYTMYLMFMIQILFFTTIMLNFMIGVIFDTYAQVTEIEQRFVYQGRANLNKEYYALKKYFKTMDEFRILIFTSTKEGEQNEEEEEQEDQGDILIAKIQEQIGQDKRKEETLQMMQYLKQIKKQQRNTLMRLEIEGKSYTEKLLNWKSSVLDEIRAVQSITRRAAAVMSESSCR